MDVDTRDETQVETWFKAGCMQCDYTSHGPGVQRVTCPNDNSVLLVMEGLIVADDIITVARLLVKAEREKRDAEMSAVAARADLGRVSDVVNRRITALRNIIN